MSLDAKQFFSRQAALLERFYLIGGAMVLGAAVLLAPGRDLLGVLLGVLAAAAALHGSKIAVLSFIERQTPSRRRKFHKIAAILLYKVIAIALLILGIRGGLAVGVIGGLVGYLFAGSFVLMVCYKSIFSGLTKSCPKRTE